MKRRGFLGLLASVVASAVFDPELALWVPGREDVLHSGAARVDYASLTLETLRSALAVLRKIEDERVARLFTGQPLILGGL